MTFLQTELRLIKSVTILLMGFYSGQCEMQLKNSTDISYRKAQTFHWQLLATKRNSREDLPDGDRAGN